MSDGERAPVLPGVLGEQFRVTAMLPDAVGVRRYEVVDATQTALVLEVATRATLFDDPLSAFHGAAAICFGPGVPPTPIAAAARALHRFHHPTIPRPRGVGTIDLRPWIVTGRPSGLLLADRVEPWPAAELVALAAGLCEALAPAHARGVVHRAVGAESVYWGPGGLGLVGWTAAAVDGAPPPDSLIEPARRAPESWLGEGPTVAVDLYAAGVLLHTLAAGAPPFTGASLAWDHVHTTPPPLPAATPPALAELCRQLLAKDPARRPESARAALTVLHAAPPVVAAGAAGGSTTGSHGGAASGGVTGPLGSVAASHGSTGPLGSAAASRTGSTGPLGSAAANSGATGPLGGAGRAASAGLMRRPGLALRALDWSAPLDGTADSLPALPALGRVAGDAPGSSAPSVADVPGSPEPGAPVAPEPGAPVAPEPDAGAALAGPDPASPDPAPPVPDDPVGAARHLLACGRPDDALRRCVDVEGARRTDKATRIELRVLAGRALLARGDTTRAFEAFDLALHADPGPAPALLAEIAGAAVEAGQVGVAVDAGLRTLIADVAAGRALLARVVGRVLLRRADPPVAHEMLPLAVACTHLALRAVEAGDDAAAWFSRGREVGQAGMMALVGPPAPVFPLHLALCAWGVDDDWGATSAVRLAREHGLRVPQTVEHVGAEVCLKLALLTTHQKDRARTLPAPLAAWARAID